MFKKNVLSHFDIRIKIYIYGGCIANIILYIIVMRVIFILETLMKSGCGLPNASAI